MYYHISMEQKKMYVHVVLLVIDAILMCYFCFHYHNAKPDAS